MSSFLQSVVSKVVILRGGEGSTALLMFAYSFLAMTAYNIFKPITRSKFISDFGADNLPYVLLVAGLLIGVLMHQYTRLMGKLPRRAVLPVTQAGIIVLLIVFWALLRTDWAWVPVGLYLFGMILGILLISQFWTLANDIYDPRQAKRLFGFIGGGASLGGALGSGITAFVVDEVGSGNLVLVSAATLVLCTAIITLIVKRHAAAGNISLEEEKGVGGGEALRLLAGSPHLRVIALVIGFAAAGATIIEQQLNMAAEAGGGGEDAITSFLAQVQLYISLAGFVLQVAFTSRIHRSLGLAIALLMLPFGLGSTAIMILMTGAIWAPAVARVLDSTFRYTVDKTTREILFLPLPADLKYRAKPFIDVTVDRFAKALAALLMLVLIKPWGLGFGWRQLSYASLSVTAIWIVTALVARREYLSAFRRSIGTMTIAPDALRAEVTDSATIETFVEELSNPDATAVLYAMNMLETLDKRNLITPLLLHHESAPVRTRALMALAATKTRIGRKWAPAVARMVQDPDVDVRAAALRALAALSHEDASAMMRRHLDDPEPRVAVAAAAVLANAGQAGDVAAAEATLRRLIADSREGGTAGRIESANALAHIQDPQFRSLLVPLLYDHDIRVVQEAIRSARMLGAADGLFLPGLMSLLGHRALKADARDTLVGYGETIVGALGHALRDRREHIWLRRHIPATLALIPSQSSMDALVASLEEPDGFLRYKAIAAIEQLTREHPHINFPRPVVEQLLVQETSRYYNCLTLHYNLLQRAGDAQHSLLGRALTDKMARGLDRIYRLLGLLYHVGDIAACRHTIEQGEAKRRAAAIEYLDNLLGGMVRRRVLPILDDTPLADKVRHANSVLRSRPRELEDTLAQLVHDDDPVVAASAIHFVARQRLWMLTEDIEYVISHRPADDVSVIEAATWALLSKRAAESAQSTVLESLPAVELADRVRAIPLFEFVSVDELFRIADIGQELRVPAGRELYRQTGSVVSDVQFLLEGTVEVGADLSEPREVAAPAVVGLEQVLQGTPAPAGLKAVEPVACFRIQGTDFLTMLADNVLLAQGLFRMLLAPGQEAFPLTVATGQPDPIERAALPQGIDVALLLRHHPLLERASAPELLALTAAATDVPLTRGETLFAADDLPALYLVLTGEVVLESPSAAPVVVGDGSTLGLVETLAGVASGWTARITRDGRALRVDREKLFNVLGDEVELMQELFSAVLRFRLTNRAQN
jgi:AAA family ATP:ADP antiporter